MTNETKEKIREEFRKFCPGAMENLLIEKWWLSKIDELLKEQRDGLVEKIEKIIKEKKEEDLQLKNTDQISAGFIKAQKIGCLSALYDIISLINQDK